MNGTDKPPTPREAHERVQALLERVTHARAHGGRVTPSVEDWEAMLLLVSRSEGSWRSPT